MYRKMITKAPIIEMFVLSGNKLNILKSNNFVFTYELKDSEKNQYTYGLYIKQIIN